MDITISSEVLQEVLLGQLKEANENRYYLMALLKQLERDTSTRLAELESELEQAYAELSAMRAGHTTLEAESPQ